MAANTRATTTEKTAEPAKVSERQTPEKQQAPVRPVVMPDKGRIMDFGSPGTVSTAMKERPATRPPEARRTPVAAKAKEQKPKLDLAAYQEKMWGKQPAPGPEKGGWVNENMVDSINRALPNQGDIGKSIDALLSRMGRGAAKERQQPAKARGMEPGE